MGGAALPHLTAPALAPPASSLLSYVFSSLLPISCDETGGFWGRPTTPSPNSSVLGHTSKNVLLPPWWRPTPLHSLPLIAFAPAPQSLSSSLALFLRVSTPHAGDATVHSHTSQSILLLF